MTKILSFEEIKKIVPFNCESNQPEYLVDPLRVLVHSKGGKKVAYLPISENFLEEGFLEINEADKIHHEIFRWDRAICNPGNDWEYLKQMSTPLSQLPKNEQATTCVLARTARMLLFLDALFAASGRKSIIEENCYINDINKRLWVENDGLKNAFEESKVYFHYRDEWYVSLQLLLVTIIAYSQCEQFRPMFWELYSAGSARDDLIRRWDRIEKVDYIIDLVAMFIRYQLGPEQNAHLTGNLEYKEVIRKFTENWKSYQGSGEYFSVDSLINALRITSFVGQARNHRIPESDNPNEQRGDLLINQGGLSRWPSDEIEIDFQKIFNEPDKSVEFTWCYSRIKNNTWPGNMLNFKSYFEDKNKRNEFTFLNNITTNQLEGKNITAFAFNRNQIQDIGLEIADVIEQWGGDFEKCKTLFRCQLIEIPLPFKVPKSNIENESFIEIRLNDWYAAERFLFHDDSDFTDSNIGDTAGDLFYYLFKKAIKKFNLSEMSLTEKQKLYIPYILMERMLRIVYRLRSGSCLLISVVFDNNHIENIPIPDSLPSDNIAGDKVISREQIIKYIANYVPALVLNQAMTVGFRTCDINFDDLLSNSASDKADKVSGEEWRKFIENAFESNNYWLLCDHYLKDYNTERRCVQMTSRIAGNIRRGIISNLYRDLSQYFKLIHDLCCARRVFLGIDIGASWIKFQFYEFKQTGYQKRFSLVKIGRGFRKLTPQKLKLHSGEAVQQFISYILEKIDLQFKNYQELGISASCVEAIGIAWPGPVRNNRPAGTSAILEKFGFSKKIIENRIENIFMLDIIDNFRKQWTEIFPSNYRENRPSISLVNDGNAEGIGLVITENVDTRKRLAVLKLGTGTAGAMFEEGHPHVGMWEPGKVLLDLGANPNIDFPEGTANKYMSANTLPILVAKENKILSKKGLNSVKIGGILAIEKNNKKFDFEALGKLMYQLGLWSFASKLPDQIDVEVLKEIIEQDLKADPEILTLMQNEMLEPNISLLKQRICSQVFKLGHIDLEYILDHHFNESVITKDCLTSEVRKKLKNLIELNKKCAEILGSYLGDFIAYLLDKHHVEIIIASGGVLSDRTGEIVRKKAVERVKLYGLNLTLNGKVFSLNDNYSRKITTNRKKAKDDYDFGTLGAAAYAASEYLFELKQQGIAKIRLELEKLGPNDKVKIYGNNKKGYEIEFIKDQRISNNVIKLNEHSLEYNEIIDYLDKDGVFLGFHHSVLTIPDRQPSLGEQITEYTRWIVDIGR